MPEEEIPSAVEMEIRQVLPTGSQDLEADYFFIPAQGGRRTVVFVGCQKELCAFWVEMLQRAGLRPLVMDHDGLAILNCFHFLHEKEEPPFLILNIGFRTTNFVLTAGANGFILLRDILFGGQNIAKAIASAKGFSVEDAMIYAKKGENEAEMQTMVVAGIEELIFEITRGITYFKNRTDKFPETLFLTGGIAPLPGVRAALEDGIKIETVLWNPLEEIVKTEKLFFAEDQLPSEEILKNGFLFPVALGLFLRESR